jgi:hypothetical protein
MYNHKIDQFLGYSTDFLAITMLSASHDCLNQAKT